MTSSEDPNDKNRVQAYDFVKMYLIKPLTRDMCVRLSGLNGTSDISVI